jgi:peptide/nickel transport system permease protein
MRRFLIRRLLAMIPVLVLVSLIAFAITSLLPGDAALAILGESQAKDETLYRAVREELGLDRPVAVQYLRWVGKAALGDLGVSFRTKQPVAEAIRQRLAPTLQLTLLSLALALAAALPIGLLSAIRPNSWADTIGTVLALSGVALPHFWLGIMLMFLFAVWLGLLPPSGYASLLQDPLGSLKLMLMPCMTLATGLAAVITRQVRSALLEVLHDDYIRTARSRGLTEQRVVVGHALRNALIPVVTIIGMQTGRLFGGAVVVETIFSIPGVGRLAVDSIFFRDFPVLQGVVLLMAVAVLSINLLTDVLYAYIDPRIRYT